MNPQTVEDARKLLLSVEHRMQMVKDTTEVVICPPNVYLAPFSHHVHLTKLGVQNISWANAGAYTGETSPAQVKQWNVNYVILGHSERRLYCGENDTEVNKKIATALTHKMYPVVCLGGEPGAKKLGMKRLVTKQFAAAVKGLDKSDIPKIIFAYEPIWAISTMKNSEPASGEHALELIEHIRELLAKKIGKESAKNATVLYGGTVNKVNVHEFAKYPEISGALVGGASLDSENFWAVVKEFNRESIHRA